MMRTRFGSVCGSLLLLSLAWTSPASAVLSYVFTSPLEPTTCDSVEITVTGSLPDPCYEIVSATIRGPEEIPCMRITPCPSRFGIEITVRQPNPDSGQACPTVIEPYARSFKVGKLAAGEYGVLAHERVVPYTGGDSTVSESYYPTSFRVTPDSLCTPLNGCYILSFHSPFRDPLPGSFCDAVARPGGTACLWLNLMHTIPVGGLQTTIEARDQNGAPADPYLHATSVEAVSRAEGFQVAWTAEGSRTKVILYSTTGATVPPGEGAVLRICYSVAPETPPQTFRVSDTETIVADGTGNAIAPCPTLIPVLPGLICVGQVGCDLNGDGVSDVLDIIRLVRCALASTQDSTSACPDSVAARADCNSDGSIDIRDVICCVRKIVAIPFGTGHELQAPIITPVVVNTIGFEGSVQWTNAVEGIARVRVDVPPDWGGSQFKIDASAASARIRALRLLGGTSEDHLEWGTTWPGVVNAMLYTTSTGPRPMRIYIVEVSLERWSAGSGPMVLGGARAGTRAGFDTEVMLTHPNLNVSQPVVQAPALLGARPNPSKGGTEIGFVLPTSARASLRVYDIRGRLVRTLVEGPTPAGIHRIPWDGTDERGRTAVSGIYFAKLEVGATVRSERLMLLR